MSVLFFMILRYLCEEDMTITGNESTQQIVLIQKGARPRVLDPKRLVFVFLEDDPLINYGFTRIFKQISANAGGLGFSVLKSPAGYFSLDTNNFVKAVAIPDSRARVEIEAMGDAIVRVKFDTHCLKIGEGGQPVVDKCPVPGLNDTIGGEFDFSIYDVVSPQLFKICEKVSQKTEQQRKLADEIRRETPISNEHDSKDMSKNISAQTNSPGSSSKDDAKRVIQNSESDVSKMSDSSKNSQPATTNHPISNTKSDEEYPEPAVNETITNFDNSSDDRSPKSSNDTIYPSRNSEEGTLSPSDSAPFPKKNLPGKPLSENENPHKDSPDENQQQMTKQDPPITNKNSGGNPQSDPSVNTHAPQSNNDTSKNQNQSEDDKKHEKDTIQNVPRNSNGYKNPTSAVNSSKEKQYSTDQDPVSRNGKHTVSPIDKLDFDSDKNLKRRVKDDSGSISHHNPKFKKKPKRLKKENFPNMRDSAGRFDRYKQPNYDDFESVSNDHKDDSDSSFQDPSNMILPENGNTSTRNHKSGDSREDHARVNKKRNSDRRRVRNENQNYINIIEDKEYPPNRKNTHVDDRQGHESKKQKPKKKSHYSPHRVENEKGDHVKKTREELDRDTKTGHKRLDQHSKHHKNNRKRNHKKDQHVHRKHNRIEDRNLKSPQFTDLCTADDICSGDSNGGYSDYGESVDSDSVQEEVKSPYNAEKNYPFHRNYITRGLRESDDLSTHILENNNYEQLNTSGFLSESICPPYIYQENVSGQNNSCFPEEKNINNFNYEDSTIHDTLGPEFNDPAARFPFVNCSL